MAGEDTCLSLLLQEDLSVIVVVWHCGISCTCCRRALCVCCVSVCCTSLPPQSVFKVCDAPELHSAGYHIKFDLQQDPALGYILPSWMNEEECIPAGDGGDGYCFVHVGMHLSCFPIV